MSYFRADLTYFHFVTVARCQGDGVLLLSLTIVLRGRHHESLFFPQNYRLRGQK